MTEKVINALKIIKKHKGKTVKSFQRFCLLSPLFVYALSIFIWINEQNPVSSFETAVSISEVKITETVKEDVSQSALDETLDDAIAEYDMTSSILTASYDNTKNSIMSQLFSGQGGYDSFAPSGLDFSANVNAAPRSLIEELNTEKDYPNVSYSTYRIREGDMIGVIAERFGVTQDTLISVNNIRQTRNIQIGEYLRIPSMEGILYAVKEDGETPQTIAEKYEVSPEKTASVNGFETETALEVGNMVFVPDALLDWATLQEINGDLFKIPIRNRYYISSSFGWRNSPFTGARSYHSAVDMAAPRWTPIYASLVGQVSTVRYGDPVYGNYIIITHHSGYSTLYAHMVDINVSRWEYVDTNSVIGWVGSTGMSTGDHLHFAVLRYGTAINPTSLWN